MRKNLRLELLRLCDNQAGASRMLDIDEPRLSRILRCWTDPSPKEMAKFKKLLGSSKASRLIRDTGQGKARDRPSSEL